MTFPEFDSTGLGCPPRCREPIKASVKCSPGELLYQGEPHPVAPEAGAGLPPWICHPLKLTSPHLCRASPFSQGGSTLKVQAGSCLSHQRAAVLGGADSCSWDIGAPVGGQTLPTPDCPVQFQMLLLEIFAEHIFHFPGFARFI